MSTLKKDERIHASLQPPKPQPPCCPNCRGIPPTVATHESAADDSDDEGSDDGFKRQFPTHRRRRYWLQPSIDALRQSAADGCPLCALIHRQCLRSIHGDPHEWEHGNGDPRLEINHGGTAPYVLDVRMGDWYVQGFNFVAATADWSKRYDAYFNKAKDPNLIKFWVGECETRHLEHCAPDTDFLPTRLVDLGISSPEQDTDVVKIIDTGDSDIEDRRYVALSHRWDHFTAECPQSTTDSISQHRRGISLASLPQSFRYAACVARQLGIRYLWIDSLCILQDSRKDWVGESAQMGRVYGAAFCTVATSNDALDAYGGLTKNETGSRSLDPDDDEYLPQWVEVYVGKGSREESRQVDQKDDDSEGHIVRIFDKTPSDWESMLEESALSGRGWTLQERQLSRRVVHVTRNAILWECRTCRGSEQVPWTDRVAANMHKEARHRIKDAIDDPRRAPRRGDAIDRYKTWYDIVWDYSNRLLTIEADKLPGLAGLAETMAALVGDEYVAGLWGEDLVSGLLWKSRRWPAYEEYGGEKLSSSTIMPAPPGFYPGPNGPLGHSRPEQKRAPTWSWMSLNGPVVHWMGFRPVSYRDPELNDGPAVTPQDIAVEWDAPGADRDPFSQAEGGRLTITGCLQPAKAKYPLRDLFLSNLDYSFWAEGYKTLHDPTEEELATPSGGRDDEDIADALKVLRARGSHHSDQEIRDCMGVIQYDVLDDAVIPNQTLYVLALRRVQWDVWDTPYCIYAKRDERGFTFADQVFGLALVPTGEAENEYRRVGVAEFVVSSWFKEENRRKIVVV